MAQQVRPRPGAHLRFTHVVGPTSGASIVAFLFMTDPSPGLHVPMIAIGIASFWLLPFLLRVDRKSSPGRDDLGADTDRVTLFGVYNYGGVSSPFLAWLLIALANGFFYLSDRPSAYWRSSS